MRRKWKVIVPVLALLATCLLFRFLLFIGYVPSESMEPTLKKWSIIVGSRLFGELKAGDIIVFWHEGKLLVKRIAATEGNVVSHCGKLLTVLERCFYVQGDNVGNSWDSRYWGNPFVRKDEVTARLIQ